MTPYVQVTQSSVLQSSGNHFRAYRVSFLCADVCVFRYLHFFPAVVAGSMAPASFSLVLLKSILWWCPQFLSSTPTAFCQINDGNLSYRLYKHSLLLLIFVVVVVSLSTLPSFSRHFSHAFHSNLRWFEWCRMWHCALRNTTYIEKMCNRHSHAICVCMCVACVLWMA